MSLQRVTSQTVGPYLRIGLDWLASGTIAPEGAAGERVTVAGRLLDGDGKPVDDGVLEVWQADTQGRYGGDAEFRGFGRIPTDAEGRFHFSTVKPGRVPGAGGLQAPHLLVSVFARGMLKRVATRMYFPGEPANAEDPILALVPLERRHTLIANGSGGALAWDVVLQGADETVFFDV